MTECPIRYLFSQLEYLNQCRYLILALMALKVLERIQDPRSDAMLVSVSLDRWAAVQLALAKIKVLRVLWDVLVLDG